MILCLKQTSPFPSQHQLTPPHTESTISNHKSDPNQDITNSPESAKKATARVLHTLTLYKVWKMEVKDTKYEEELKVTKTAKNQEESFEAMFRSVQECYSAFIVKLGVQTMSRSTPEDFKVY